LLAPGFRVEAITAESLISFLRERLQLRSFVLFTPVLTEPFIYLLCSLPREVKWSSSVYLALEKRRVNGYAVRRLRGCGYRFVYYVGRLHAKMLVTEDFVVVGSANFTERALSNREVILVVWGNYRRIPRLAAIAKSIIESAEPAEEDKNAGRPSGAGGGGDGGGL